MKTTLGFLAMLTSSAFAASSVHEFTLPSIDGAPAPLSAYKGKVALIVNVASQCGYMPQYAGLEKLYEKYKDRGLVVLGSGCSPTFARRRPWSRYRRSVERLREIAAELRIDMEV